LFHDLAQTIQDWEHAHLPQGWHCLAVTRAEAAWLNRALRAVLHPGDIPPWVIGERVIQRHNDYRGTDLRTGQLGVLRAVDFGRDELIAEFDGIPVAVTSQYANQWWDYGYASTVHKAQGGEWDQVAFVRFDPTWLTDAPPPPADDDAEPDDLLVTNGRTITRRVLYTAMTRGRQGFHLFAPDPVALIAASTRTATQRRLTKEGRNTRCYYWTRQRLQALPPAPSGGGRQTFHYPSP
jgi:ATP-dependent exoDNAse (exonuclease V) alpha subunit